VTYVLYLVEEDWAESDGGALELYPSLGKGEPASKPSKRLVPEWNSLLLFRVEPGESFHSVQEVTSGRRPRLTVSGWYHHHHRVDDDDDRHVEEKKTSSTLAQQKAGEVVGVDDDFFFDVEEDGVRLVDFVNPSYLRKTAQQKLRRHFCDSSAFLREDLAAKLKAAATQADERDLSQSDDDAGVSDDWVLAGPPQKRRFLRLLDNTDSDWRSLREFFRSNTFRRFLADVTGVRTTRRARATFRRFRPGLDYTVAYALTEPPRLDCTYAVLGGDTTDDTLELWASGDVGGFETYLDSSCNDDDQGRDDVYEDTEEPDLLSVPAGHNVLSLVLRDPGTLRFVKFLSSRAPGSRFDLELVAEIHPDDLPADDDDGRSDDDDDDDDDDAATGDSKDSEELTPEAARAVTGRTTRSGRRTDVANWADVLRNGLERRS